MVATRKSLDCVEARVVSPSTRAQLLLPHLALAVGVAAVAFGSALLRANARGQLEPLLIGMAVIGPIVVLMLVVHGREGMRTRNEFALFQLVEEDRRKLSLPDVEPPPTVWNGGSWFALRCEGDRAQLAKGTMTLEITRLGVVPTLLLSERGKVVGVELTRNGVLLRRRATGPNRYLTTPASHAKL